MRQRGKKGVKGGWVIGEQKKIGGGGGAGKKHLSQSMQTRRRRKREQSLHSGGGKADDNTSFVLFTIIAHIHLACSPKGSSKPTHSFAQPVTGYRLAPI